MEQIRLFNNDCLIALKELPENSVDSIVTDPPYGLSFMNKKWDYDVPSTEIWQECLRVLKPGGHLLAFGGTRTYHRMAVAIENSGFSIRDQIMWIYGSGFPKSYNIGKAVDKICGNEREVVGKDEDFIRRNPNNTGVNRLVTDDSGVNKDNRKKQAVKNENAGVITKGKTEWEGWGTALKPAVEPIVLARKPFKGGVAENVLEWGTGGLNIDGSRVEGIDPANAKRIGKSYKTDKSNLGNSYNLSNEKYKDNITVKVGGNLEGRFPANVIFDEEAGRILDEQSGYSKGKIGMTQKATPNTNSLFVINSTGDTKINDGITDFGGASRYFLNVDNTDEEDFDTSTNHNPIVMARKPFKGSVAENVLEWGTGGLNIDESRIPTDDNLNGGGYSKNYTTSTFLKNGGKLEYKQPEGRFPANVIFDEAAGRILDEQSGFSKSVGGVINGNKPQTIYGNGKGIPPITSYSNFNDQGGASRFFYCAKASKNDRNEGANDLYLYENNLICEIKTLNQLLKDISVDMIKITEEQEWNTILFGSNIMEQYHQGIKSITSIITKLIIQLITLNYSPHLNIKDCIVDAIKMIRENGLNLVDYVEHINQLKQNITNEKMEYHLGVVSVVLPTLLEISKKGKTGNFHATVKPTKLMEYLIKLITPKGGVVLDPFMGSGSTGKAAIKNDFNFIGIEREKEYFDIAKARIEHAKGSGLFKPEINQDEL